MLLKRAELSFNFFSIFDRETISMHYCRRMNYRVQTLKTTALVDTETQAILDVHCLTRKLHDTQLASLDADKVRLDEITRKPPGRGRETADKTSDLPAQRPRA